MNFSVIGILRKKEIKSKNKVKTFDVHVSSEDGSKMDFLMYFRVKTVKERKLYRFSPLTSTDK